MKNEGSNHMKCNYCGKDWCWICQEIFTSTEEHYGNRRSKCYNRMYDNYNTIICSKCEIEMDENFILKIVDVVIEFAEIVSLNIF